MTTPTVLFGAAADLERVLHAGRQGHAEERRQPGQPELFVAGPGQQGRTSTCSGRSGRPARPAQAVTQPVARAGHHRHRPADDADHRRRRHLSRHPGRRRHRGRRRDRRQSSGSGSRRRRPARRFGTTGTRRGVSVGDGKVYTLAAGNRVVALNKDTGAAGLGGAAHSVGLPEPGGPPGAPRQHRQGRDHLPRRHGLRRHQRRQPRRGVRREIQRRQHRLVVLRRRRAGSSSSPTSTASPPTPAPPGARCRPTATAAR